MQLAKTKFAQARSASGSCDPEKQGEHREDHREQRVPDQRVDEVARRRAGDPPEHRKDEQRMRADERAARSSARIGGCGVMAAMGGPPVQRPGARYGSRAGSCACSRPANAQAIGRRRVAGKARANGRNGSPPVPTGARPTGTFRPRGANIVAKPMRDDLPFPAAPAPAEARDAPDAVARPAPRRRRPPGAGAALPAAQGHRLPVRVVVDGVAGRGGRRHAGRVPAPADARRRFRRGAGTLPAWLLGIARNFARRRTAVTEVPPVDDDVPDGRADARRAACGPAGPGLAAASDRRAPPALPGRAGAGGAGGALLRGGGAHLRLRAQHRPVASCSRPHHSRAAARACGHDRHGHAPRISPTRGGGRIDGVNASTEP